MDNVGHFRDGHFEQEGQSQRFVVIVEVVVADVGLHWRHFALVHVARNLKIQKSFN